MKYIVSDRHKFVYFVVQKAACTSIKTALLPLFDPEPDADGETQQPFPSRSDVHKFFDNSGHQKNRKQLIRELDGRYRDYFKFAFVRNPWDRLVSCYLDKLTEGRAGLNSPPKLAARVYPGMPFAEFVEVVHTTPDNEANIHFKSQCSVICGREESRPILADFVGRFENLAADFGAVVERIEEGRARQLPHLMRAKNRRSRSYGEFYDDRLKDLVYERYKDDIEKFSYSF
jgi:hypothetical protein